MSVNCTKNPCGAVRVPETPEAFEARAANAVSVKVIYVVVTRTWTEKSVPGKVESPDFHGSGIGTVREAGGGGPVSPRSRKMLIVREIAVPGFKSNSNFQGTASGA